MATNICVWIKTLVYESLNEMRRPSVSYFNFSMNIVNTLSNEYGLIGNSLNRFISVSGFDRIYAVITLTSVLLFYVSAQLLNVTHTHMFLFIK